MKLEAVTGHPVTPAVRWGVGTHSFELRSADADVLARAAIVFRPWRQTVGTETLTRSWTVGPHQDAPDVWTVATGDAPDIHIAGRNGAVLRVEYLAVQAILESPPEVVTVHAALIARDGQGVLISGSRESGKSTLACGLWQRGFSLLGDDIAILNLATGGLTPTPRRVSLRSPSRMLLGDDFWTRIEHAPATEPTPEGLVFHPDEVDGTRPRATTLRAIVFLERPGAGTARTGPVARRLPAAQAALAILPQLNIIRRLDAGAAIAEIAPMLSCVPAYDVRRSPLADMVDAVAEIVDRNSA